MPSFDKILSRVNVAAVLVTGFEACMNFGFVAYAVRVLGDASAANYLVATFWFALFVAELPTGYLTDRWGGRTSLTVSLVLRAAAFLLFYWGAHSTPLVFLANFIAGVATTFLTGTFTAQVMCECRHQGVEIDHPRLAASALFVRSLGLILGTAVGYLVVRQAGVRWLWPVSAAWALLAAVYVLARWSAVRARPCMPIVLHYRSAWSQVLGTRGLLVTMLLFSACRTLLLPISVNAVILIIPGLDGDPGQLFVFYLASGLVGLVLAKGFPAVSAFAARQRMLINVLTVLAIAAVSGGNQIVAGLGFLGFLVFSAVSETQLRHAFYERIPPDHAGAVNSVQSLFENVLGALALVLSAVLISEVSMRSMYLASALAYLLVCAGAGWARNKSWTA
ncbi:MFS transporter [Verminephrobacter aporrectodeae subsp. tuberculatae]|uniref:MFS transporter n=1 Tax=Verminephrobacter aporrectodeae TaxID=1110389 RepID=UPI00224346EB|nr:MFS transporter [Verminephrobacter aporrectodeae]MCW8206475.1 MFS transporter [Verminephrobacter aporrectodeae subsp. tuberculatae]